MDLVTVSAMAFIWASIGFCIDRTAQQMVDQPARSGLAWGLACSACMFLGAIVVGYVPAMQSFWIWVPFVVFCIALPVLLVYRARPIEAFGITLVAFLLAVVLMFGSTFAVAAIVRLDPPALRNVVVGVLLATPVLLAIRERRARARWDAVMRNV
jgi:drug/metabolite transporter (DMT)-like permease